MVNSIPVHKEVAVSFASALIFGVYLMTLIFCVRWLLFCDEGWRLKKGISWATVITTLLIFSSYLVYLALSFRGTIATVKYLMDHPNGPGYQRPPWEFFVMYTCANIAALLADCILIFRCWVVYGKYLAIIIFPVILWLGGIVCTVLEISLQIVHLYNPLAGPHIWDGVNMYIGPATVLVPFWASTAALNVYCTYMLIRRIYQATAKSERATSTRQFRFIMRTLAESGTLYLLATTAHLTAWCTKDGVTIQVLSMITMPVIGITFNVALIRAAQGRTEGWKETVTGRRPVSEMQFHHSASADID